MRSDLPRHKPLPGEWSSTGACIGMSPGIFTPGDDFDEKLAKRACARCPVRTECLEHALAQHEVGVWGGTVGRERRLIRRRRQLGLAS